MRKHIRTINHLQKKLDSMKAKYGEKVSIDHGVSVYQYDHCEFTEGNYYDRSVDSLTVYVKDFNGKIIEYVTVTDEDLRAPKKNELFHYFVSCYVEPEFPTIFNMYEYQLSY